MFVYQNMIVEHFFSTFLPLCITSTATQLGRDETSRLSKLKFVENMIA